MLESYSVTAITVMVAVKVTITWAFISAGIMNRTSSEISLEYKGICTIYIDIFMAIEVSLTVTGIADAITLGRV